MFAPRAASTVAIGRDREGAQRRADQRHVQGPALARRAVTVSGGARDLHAEGPSGRGGGGAEGALLVAGRDEDAEGEPAADHDLLDVDDLDAGGGQCVEHGGGHAGPVRAGDRDEQRARCGVGHARNPSRPGRSALRAAEPVQDRVEVGVEVDGTRSPGQGLGRGAVPPGRPARQAAGGANVDGCRWHWRRGRRLGPVGDRPGRRPTAERPARSGPALGVPRHRADRRRLGVQYRSGRWCKGERASRRARTAATRSAYAVASAARPTQRSAASATALSR